MIKSVRLKNFKCFNELKLPLLPLTLMTGYNGAGKSTVLQTILLMAQAIKADKGGFPRCVDLNGELVRLGTPSEVLKINSQSKEIDIEFESETEKLFWGLFPDASSVDMGHKNYLKVRNVATKGIELEAQSQIAQTLKETIFISAVRKVDQEFFPSPSHNPIMGDVGIHGEYAPWFFNEYSENDIPEEKRHTSVLEEVTLRRQYIAWASSIFPNSDANANRIGEWSNLVELGLRIGMGEYRRPSNIGYGISYVFPIIVAGLLAQKGQILIVDSPEAHLHPKAQSNMGIFLAHMAQAGVQVIIETHSDHLLNGIRLAVKNKTISNDKVVIHFFDNSSKIVGENSCQVISPAIDTNGAIDYWPDGFFDQSEKDMSRLMGWE